MASIVHEKHWTKAQIAALSFSQVARLNYDEMVEVVLDSGVPMRDLDCVRTLEGDTLMRHVHWAIQCCRRESDLRRATDFMAPTQDESLWAQGGQMIPAYANAVRRAVGCERIAIFSRCDISTACCRPEHRSPNSRLSPWPVIAPWVMDK